MEYEGSGSNMLGELSSNKQNVSYNPSLNYKDFWVWVADLKYFKNNI